MDRFESHDEPRTIVIAQLAFIGDMVFTTPMFDALRERWRTSRLVVVGRPAALDVLADHPAALDCIPYDKDRRDRGLAGARRLIGAVRAMRPEIFFGVTRSGRTAWLARWSGAALRVGFAGTGRSLAYNRVVQRDDELPLPQRPLGLLEPFGLQTHARPLHLAVGETRREAARTRLASAGWLGEPILALAPGAHYATKRWPEEHVARLLDLSLAEGRFRPALYGGGEEAALIGRLLAGRPGVLDRRGLRLVESVAELSLAAVFLGGDSGPAHVARGLGVPVVVMYGPTATRGPDDGRPYTQLALGLPCQPCSPHGDATCPLVHHRCLRDLEPAVVLRAVHAAAGPEN